MVNPNVSCTVNIPESKAVKGKGLAITLKEFIAGRLDQLDIQHDGEKAIRQKLRGHPRCQTRKTCVCVPHDEFAVEVIDMYNKRKKSVSTVLKSLMYLHTCTCILVRLQNVYYSRSAW